MRKTVFTPLAAAGLIIAAAPFAVAGIHGGLGDRYVLEEVCNGQGLDCVTHMRYAPGQSPSSRSGNAYWYGIPHPAVDVYVSEAVPPRGNEVDDNYIGKKKDDTTTPPPPVTSQSGITTQ